MLESVKAKLTFDNDSNLAMIQDLLSDESQWSEDEFVELKCMYAKAITVMCLNAEWMGFDTSELDAKLFILDENDYAGKPFPFTDGVDPTREKFEKAYAGDVAACMELAEKLAGGYYSKPMTVNASKFWKIAAEKGDALAMYNYGMCFRWGEYGEYADYGQAMYWFKKAAEAGHADAEKLASTLTEMMVLNSAISGAQGYGSKWYRSKMMVDGYISGADEGNAEMQYELGRQSVPGRNFDAFPRKAENAVKYYTMAANNGVIDAMFNLSRLYTEGCPGLEPDDEKAFYWMKVCADAKDAEAAYATALNYKLGKGTEADMEMFRKYLKQSADANYAKAVKMLQTLD